MTRFTMKREGGFTLLEMLVVTGLLGLLFLMLSGGLTLGLRGWARQDAAGDRLAERTEASRALRRLLGAAQAGGLSGASDRLSFIALGRLGDGRVHAVEIGLGVDRARRLVLRWRVRRGCGSAEPTAEEVLAERIAALHLRYQGVTPGWRGVWNGPEPPALIGIGIVPERGNPWAEIMVNPLVTEMETGDGS